MRGVVYYYSSTGNTKLAVEYLRNHVENADIDLCNIATDEIIGPDGYDVVGFASFAEYLGVPTLMKNFIESLESQQEKPAFLLITFGGFIGPTLKSFANQVESKGFKVFSQHSLIMPMNYPPMKRNGKHSENAPSQKDMADYDEFIRKIELGIDRINHGDELKSLYGRFSLSKLVPSMPRSQAKKDFGIQQIDVDLCSKCGNCANVCAYKAIEMDPFPLVDHDRCNGCWACYNQCPKQAINVKNFKGDHQYKGPSKELKEKMR